MGSQIDGLLENFVSDSAFVTGSEFEVAGDFGEYRVLKLRC